jgi:hypothetical protein
MATIEDAPVKKPSEAEDRRSDSGEGMNPA